MKFINYFFISLIVIFISCASSQYTGKKIIGTWERVGDRGSGLIIEVKQMSHESVYLGIVSKLPNKNYPAKKDEILWSNIKPVAKNQWEGLVSLRGKTLILGTTTSELRKAKFVLVNDSLLEIYVNNQTIKWVKK